MLQTMRGVAVLALSVVFAAGCSRKPKEIDGIGDWHLGLTQKKDGYVCTPQSDGITFCSQQPQMGIADQVADILLYFRGNEETSPLVEIIVSIDRCRPEGVVMAFEKQLGPPHERAANLHMWFGKLATIIAQLPTSDGRCEINFVDPADAKRIAELRGTTAPGSGGPTETR